MNPFVGVWTYRSFHNNSEQVEDFNDIRLWQAELRLDPYGPDLVKGRIGSGGYDLDIYGSVSNECGTDSIKLRAIGVQGTQTEGWIYDYTGVLAPAWPDGDRQRPTIVGTVIRSVPHAPNRSAGLSYSFIAVNKEIPAAPYRLPDRVVSHFADLAYHPSISDTLEASPVQTSQRYGIGWAKAIHRRRKRRPDLLMIRITRSRRSGFLIWHCMRPKPRLLKSENMFSIPQRML